MRLIDRLKADFGLSGRKAKELLDRRLVFVNDRRVWIASYEVSASDRIVIAASVPPPPLRPPAILHEDADILAVDKPAGLLSVGPGSAESLLGAVRPGLTAVHRLDKETSGVLLFGLSRRGTEGLLGLFRRRRIAKTYLALVAGRLSSPRRVEAPLDGLPAVTELVPLVSSGEATLVEVQMRSGRTHQIRRHLAVLGLRLVGERTYRQSSPERKDLFKSVSRQMLHAWSVTLPHPADGRALTVTAPLPEDLKDLCGRLGLALPPEPGTR